MYLQAEGDLVKYSSDTKAVEVTSTNFYNSLFFKLGFRYEDLFKFLGLQNNRHNPGYVNDLSLEDRYKSVKPLTTNSDVSISDALSCSLMDGTATSAGDGMGQPDYTLGYPGFQQFNISVEKSTAISASNLPTRLDSSFYQIYSDFCNPEYKQSKFDLACVGIVARNYASGDFLYGFNTTYTIPITAPRHITKISTEIRSPNGNLAPINGKSTVLYKVVKPYTQPMAEEILNPQPDEEDEMLELMKKNNEIEEEENDQLSEILKGENTIASGMGVPFDFTNEVASKITGENTLFNQEGIQLQTSLSESIIKNFIGVIASQYPIRLTEIKGGRRRGKLQFDSPDVIRYLSHAIVDSIPKIKREIEKFNEDIINATTETQRKKVLDDISKSLGQPYITATGQTLIGQEEQEYLINSRMFSDLKTDEQGKYIGRNNNFITDINPNYLEAISQWITESSIGGGMNKGNALKQMNEILINGVQNNQITFLMDQSGVGDWTNITPTIAIDSPTYRNMFGFKEGMEAKEISKLKRNIKQQRDRYGDGGFRGGNLSHQPLKDISWFGSELTPSQQMMFTESQHTLPILERLAMMEKGGVRRAQSAKEQALNDIAGEIDRDVKFMRTLVDKGDVFALERKIKKNMDIFNKLLKSKGSMNKALTRRIMDTIRVKFPSIENTSYTSWNKKLKKQIHEEFEKIPSMTEKQKQDIIRDIERGISERRREGRGEERMSERERHQYRSSIEEIISGGGAD